MSPVGHAHGKESAGCKAIFERLSEYLDEELDAGLCSEVDEHLDGCAPCKKFLESLRRTVATLGDLDRPHLPDEVRREVLEAYHKLREDLDEGPAGD
jgi:RNA polymerase sigma-70 factor (ECF subfamily)